MNINFPSKKLSNIKRQRTQAIGRNPVFFIIDKFNFDDKLFPWIILELCVLISTIEFYFSFLFLSTFRLISVLTIFLL